MPPAKLLLNLIFEASNAQKNENLQICAETSETARRAPLSVIFEESVFAPLAEVDSQAGSRVERAPVKNMESEPPPKLVEGQLRFPFTVSPAGGHSHQLLRHVDAH